MRAASNRERLMMARVWYIIRSIHFGIIYTKMFWIDRRTKHLLNKILFIPKNLSKENRPLNRDKIQSKCML